MKAALALLLLLSAAGARADDGDPSSAPGGQAVGGDQSEAASEMRKQLESDPGLVEALVERVARSRIGPVISKELDPKKRATDIREWIKGDYQGAAEIALGFAKDDENGNMLFENSLFKQMSKTYYRANDGRGAYGVLKDAARKSKSVNKAEEDVSDEQRREMLKNLFEGKGSQGEKVVEGHADPGGKPASDTPASAALATSFYDRLSAGNIRGYSPQLMAFQSSLNQRRPPGAPALVETGKLDWATLSYPKHGLTFDANNLDERLRRDYIETLARLAGVSLSPRDWQDPNLESRLAAKVPKEKVPKRMASRYAAVAKARAAIAAFEAAADKAKDPNGITKGLLVELAGKQRDAARWVTAAALEEDLGRAEADDGWLTPELLAAIDAVPAPPDVRGNYKKRGEALKARHEKLKSNAQAALDLLTSDAWASSLGKIQSLMEENGGLKRNLSRDINDYKAVPFRVAESMFTQARWRRILEDLIVKYAARTSYGREIVVKRARLSRSLQVFGLIASGSSDAAHQALQ